MVSSDRRIHPQITITFCTVSRHCRRLCHRRLRRSPTPRAPETRALLAPTPPTLLSRRTATSQSLTTPSQSSTTMAPVAVALARVGWPVEGPDHLPCRHRWTKTPLRHLCSNQHWWAVPFTRVKLPSARRKSSLSLRMISSRAATTRWWPIWAWDFTWRRASLRPVSRRRTTCTCAMASTRRPSCPALRWCTPVWARWWRWPSQSRPTRAQCRPPFPAYSGGPLFSPSSTALPCEATQWRAWPKPWAQKTWPFFGRTWKGTPPVNNRVPGLRCCDTVMKIWTPVVTLSLTHSTCTWWASTWAGMFSAWRQIKVEPTGRLIQRVHWRSHCRPISITLSSASWSTSQCPLSSWRPLSTS